MLLLLKDCERIFRWHLGPSGLPICEVRTFGGVPYTLICPLCGCFHELDQTSGVIKPRCLLREFSGKSHVHSQIMIWQMTYDRWLKLHPEAANDHALIHGMTADQIGVLDKAETTMNRRAKAG